MGPALQREEGERKGRREEEWRKVEGREGDCGGRRRRRRGIGGRSHTYSGDVSLTGCHRGKVEIGICGNVSG